MLNYCVAVYNDVYSLDKDVHKEVKLAIMRVNMRPATKFRWNNNAQREQESKKPVSTGEAQTVENSAIRNETVPIVEPSAHEEEHQPEQKQTSRVRTQKSLSFDIAEENSSVSTMDAIVTSATRADAARPINAKPTEVGSLKHFPIAKSNFELESFEPAIIEESIPRYKVKSNEAMAQPNTKSANHNCDTKQPKRNEQNDKNESPWQKIVWQLMPETPVGRALVTATQRLESSGIDTAALDAQVILAHILKKDRAWLFAHHEYLLSEEEAEKFTDCVARRMAYEPVAYLIGQKEFYGLNFVVDQRVLIPRPETELLVDSVLTYLEAWVDEMPIGHELCVADIGTGCGAIAISIAANVPDVRVYATDISLGALEIARTNIQRLDDRCQVSLMQGDLLEPLRNKVDMPKVDIIVANLPYINSADYDDLAPDVRDFEPQLALEAGPQGLDSIIRLLEQAPSFLNRNGIILLEIGYDQGEAVVNLGKELIPDARFVELRQDYNGRDRLVTIAL